MKLEVFERLLLLGLLPKEGEYTTLKLLRVLREDLSFSEEENQKLEFKKEAEMIRWKPIADSAKEVAIGRSMFDLIRGILVKMDKDKKLMEEHMALYEKFVLSE